MYHALQIFALHDVKFQRFQLNRDWVIDPAVFNSACRHVNDFTHVAATIVQCSKTMVFHCAAYWLCIQLIPDIVLVTSHDPSCFYRRI